MKVAALALALSGCSFIFVERLPSNYDGSSRPVCTTSMAAPILDAVAGGLAAAVALNLILYYDDYGGGDAVDGAIAGNIGDWLIHTIASASGESAVRKCRKAVAAWDAPPDPTASAAYYCTAPPTEPALGVCSQTAAGCADHQSRLFADGRDSTPCTPTDAAVCTRVGVPGGGGKIGCAPTMAACEHIRAEAGAAAAPCVTRIVGRGRR